MINDNIRKQIEEIAARINGRKEHQYAAATYRDVNDLKEIERLVKENLDDSCESLRVAIISYNYIADRYTSMTRMSVAAKYLEESLKLMVKLHKETGEDLEKEAREVFTNLLRDRNFFVDDDCEDILNLIKGSNLISDGEIDDIYQKRMNKRRGLKNDPIEMSEEYLNVIDEVEEKIDKSRKTFGMGSCYEVWELKQKYLSEKGIDWTSPGILNPRVMFD